MDVLARTSQTSKDAKEIIFSTITNMVGTLYASFWKCNIFKRLEYISFYNMVIFWTLYFCWKQKHFKRLWKQYISDIKSWNNYLLFTVLIFSFSLLERKKWQIDNSKIWEILFCIFVSPSFLCFGWRTKLKTQV